MPKASRDCVQNIITNKLYNDFAINGLNINWLDQYFCVEDSSIGHTQKGKMS